MVIQLIVLIVTLCCAGDIHDGIDGRLNSEDDDDGDHDGEDSGGDSGGDIEERFKNCNIGLIFTQILLRLSIAPMLNSQSYSQS